MGVPSWGSSPAKGLIWPPPDLEAELRRHPGTRTPQPGAPSRGHSTSRGGRGGREDEEVDKEEEEEGGRGAPLAPVAVAVAPGGGVGWRTEEGRSFWFFFGRREWGGCLYLELVSLRWTNEGTRR